MTVTLKGKILREDHFNYDGVNLTAQRLDSSGGYVSGTRMGDEVDVFTIYGGGISRTQTTIQNCINAIGSRSASIKFAPGTWTIESNTTIPANLTSIIPAGCVFSISSGITLTFSGPLITDSDNFKTGAGTLTATDDKLLQSVAGTNTITASTLSTLTVLKDGQEFLLVPAATITGAATVNVNSTGAVNTRKNQSGGPVALVANDMIAGNMYRLTYRAAGPHYVVSNVSSYAQGATVASATTINLDTATGDYVHVSGTTAITGVTLAQGQERTIVFDGILTFTHGASLILPGALSITTAAGDTAALRGEASGVVRCIDYTSVTSAWGKNIILNSIGSSESYDYVSGITETNGTTYETVGPTGSGANNIWTGLDTLPNNTVGLIVFVESSVTTDGADRIASITTYAWATGSGPPGGLNRIQQNYSVIDDNTTGAKLMGTWALIPLTTGKIFSMTWAASNDSARDGSIYLKGYITT